MYAYLVKALLALLAHSPEIIGDVADAVNEHWGKDHIVQAQKGLEHLTKVFNDAAAVARDSGALQTSDSPKT